jgi:sulfur-oxidizing protein SoxX
MSRLLSPSVTLRAWIYATTVTIAALGLVIAGPDSTAQSRHTLVNYHIVDGAIPEPLTDRPGDPERGRRIVLDRNGGDCIICHAMPLPQRRFHGTFGPSLDGVGSRYTAAELRLRLVDARAINPQTVMPAYYKVEGLYRVLERYRGRPILTAQQVEDVVAYLLTLRGD